jgi:Ca-activated chloride channel homolog
VRSLLLRAACVFPATFVLTAALVAQQQGAGRLSQVENSAGTFRTAVDLVTLNVAVTDGLNRPVPGLGRSDFQVLEDGVAQDLSFFSATDVPLDVVLLVDSSSSVSPKLPFIEQAAAGFIATLRPIDRASVMSFTTQVRVVQPFTSDRLALRQAVHGLPARGDTALYTALYVALDNFERMRREGAADARSVRRQAIVVLTDGEDTASRVTFDDLLDRARRAGIAIYPIALDGDGLRSPAITSPRRFFSTADYALKSLAQETGGRAFFPVRLEELDGLYQAVADELSTQYALGYVPKVERKDGTYRRISVLIASRPDARSRTRMGYYSPGPTRVSR